MPGRRDRHPGELTRDDMGGDIQRAADALQKAADEVSRTNQQLEQVAREMSRQRQLMERGGGPPGGWGAVARWGRSTDWAGMSRGGGGSARDVQQRGEEAASRLNMRNRNREYQQRQREEAKEKRRTDAEAARQEKDAARMARNDRRAENRQRLREDRDAAREEQQVESTARKLARRDEQAQARQEAKRDRDAVQQRERAEQSTQAGYMAAYQRRMREHRRQRDELEQAEQKREATQTATAARLLGEHRQRQAERRSMGAAEGRLGLSTMSMLHMGGVAGRIGQAQGYAQLAEAAGYGGLARFAGPAGIAASVGLAGEQVARAGVMNARDPFLTDAQRRERTAFSFPGGESLRSWTRDWSGVTSSLQNTHEYRNPAKMVEGQRQIAQRDMRTHYGDQLADARSRAEAYRGYGPVGLPTASRGTASGQREYEEQERMQPALQERARAERELAAAQLQRADAERKLEDRQREHGVEHDRYQRMAKKRDTEPGRLSDQQARDRMVRSGASDAEMAIVWGSPTGQAMLRHPGVHEDIRRAEAAGDVDRQGDIADAADRRAKDAQRVFDRAGATEDEAKKRLALAEAGVTRARLEGATFRRNMGESQAERLGSMGVGGRQQSLSAARQLAAMGENAVNAQPELIEQARMIAPDMVRQITRKAGRDSAEIEELRALSPTDAYKYEEEGAEVDRLREKAVGEEAGAERDFAGAGFKRLEDIINRRLDALGDAIDKAYSRLEDRIKNGLVAGKTKT